MDWNGLIGAVANAASTIAAGIDNANGGNSTPVGYTVASTPAPGYGAPAAYRPPLGGDSSMLFIGGAVLLGLLLLRK